MGRSVYEQPGTKVDGMLSQQGGFQVSKGEVNGRQREWEKGKSRKQGDCAMICCCVYIIIVCKCPNDCQSVYVYIIIDRYECS
jgi:hypothetical protein